MDGKIKQKKKKKNERKQINNLVKFGQINNLVQKNKKYVND